MTRRVVWMAGLALLTMAPRPAVAAPDRVKAQARAAFRFEISVPAAAHRRADHRPRVRDDLARRTSPSRGCRSAAPACRSSAATSSGSQPGADRQSSTPPISARRVESIARFPPATTTCRRWSTSTPSSSRADGHVLWMHDDQWEGQHWNRSPGNLYSASQKVHIDPTKPAARSSCVADQVHAADRGAGRHAVRQALQDPEPDR